MIICDIRHPFLFEAGSSQMKRALNAVKAGNLEIDGRKLADFLYYIYRYANQVNLHSYQKDASEGEYILLNDWRRFFEKSIPFLLANIARFDTEAAEQEFERRRNEFKKYPTPQNLDLLIDYCFEELLQPLLNWYQALQDDERRMREFTGISATDQGKPFGFKREMADLIGSELSAVLRKFISASKKASYFHCIPTRNFFPFLNQQIWNIPVTELVSPAGTGKTLAELEKDISDAFSQFLGAVRRISAFSVGYIAESLEPLEEAFRKFHEPHLGLLFTFLELFQYIQGDINKLSQKHLDFFYQKVLRIKPRAHQPDYAHLVFEVAQHLEEYLIPAGTQFKDGKDLRKTDILFGLPEEIVIDKAKVESLRTLYLNYASVNASLPLVKTRDNNNKPTDCIDINPVTALEGVYMAPVGNSADGNGKSFPDETIPNWPTLGSKESKTNAPGKTTPAAHPYARIGFMLASPVLFLQEGRREIVIKLCLDFNGNDSIVSLCGFFEKLDEALRKPYYKLTERFFKRLTEAFSGSALSNLKSMSESQTVLPGTFDLFKTEHKTKFTPIEIKLLECYLEPLYSELICNNKNANEQWAALFNRLANPLSDDGRAYLSNLLAAQNPYIFGYDIDKYLQADRKVSCRPSTPCDTLPDKTELENKMKQSCYLDRCNYNRLVAEKDNGTAIRDNFFKYLPQLFPLKNPTACLPVKLDPDYLKTLTDAAGVRFFSDTQIELIKKYLVRREERPECEPLFSCCEIELIKRLLDQEMRSACYLNRCNYERLEKEILLDGTTIGTKITNKLSVHFPDRFPSGNPRKCLPVFLDPEELMPLQVTDANGQRVSVFSDRELSLIKKYLICDNVFHILLSGKEGWYKPKRVKTRILLNSTIKDNSCCKDELGCLDTFDGTDKDSDLQFEFTVALDEEEPPIVCFDKEKLKEDYQFDTPLPVAKIELNSELKLDYSNACCDCGCPDSQSGSGACTCSGCCLLKPDDSQNDGIALYEFFRGLKVVDAGIDVQVCGVKKNLVVQNDENVMNVNEPMLPFGVRPTIIDSGVLSDQFPVTNDGDSLTDPHSNMAERPSKNLVGPNFYIGSYEMFKKKWKKVCLHLNWKNKPSNFTEYYAAYAFDTADNVGLIQESDFEVNISVLDKGEWSREKIKDSAGNNPYIKKRDVNICAGPHPVTLHNNRELFQNSGNAYKCECPKDLPTYPAPFPYMQTIKVERRYFDVEDVSKMDICHPLARYTQGTREGFIRLNLENQDFFHKDYAYVLSRQVIALSKFPNFNQMSLDTAIMFNTTGKTITIQDIIDCIYKWSTNLGVNLSLFELVVVGDNDPNAGNAIIEKLNNIIYGSSDNINSEIAKALNDINNGLQALLSGSLFQLIMGRNPNDAGDSFLPENLFDLYDALKKALLGDTNTPGFLKQITDIKNEIQEKYDMLNNQQLNRVLIPNEPWTPTIQNLALDYTACATREDIELIHLYPYEGTYKHEDLEVSPTLLPYFDDEGTLFIGLKNLRPGNSLNLLFQLAEATADSELDRAQVEWAYLANNQWIPLREGFEIISDGTKGLTVSGVVQIAVPFGISRTGNTIMPADLYWIKAFVNESDEGRSCESRIAQPIVNVKCKSANPNRKNIRPGKVKAICDTLAVYTQAAKVVFEPTPDNDLNRLREALPAGQIAKMVEPRVGIKKVLQPYPSFSGRAPEEGTNFYQRVSEHLRHKGRGVAAFDYETLILEAFPEIFKVKCINHDFGLSARTYRKDLELAPGFVVLAVVPDLTKLQPGEGMEPKAPVSLLEDIKAYLKKRISPFVRLKVLNPRYEKVDINVTVKLRKGKNRAYYKAKLKEDITLFMAPWYITKDSDKLVFGQSVNYSEIIKFIERLDYIDFVTCLELWPDPDLQGCEEEKTDVNTPRQENSAKPCCGSASSAQKIIYPLTARSILTGGNICVKLKEEECDKFHEFEDSQPTITSNHNTDFYAVCKPGSTL